MKSKRLKYGIGFAVIGCAFLYLMWTSFSSSFQFALTPSELIARQNEYMGKSVKVVGVVEPGSLVVSGRDHKFKIDDDKGQSIAVHFAGITPNTFREGAEVVASGKIDVSTGTFEATEILAKCASKYEGK